MVGTSAMPPSRPPGPPVSQRAPLTPLRAALQNTHASNTHARTPSKPIIVVHPEVSARQVAAQLMNNPEQPPAVPDFPVECLRRLGRGGFGDVWLGRCRDGSLGTQAVAVKFIALTEEESDEETTVADVEREVAVHRRLSDCEALIRLVAHTIHTQRAVLLLEHFEGLELLQHVSRQLPAGCLSEGEARPIVTSVLGALSHMHTRGVAHLDLKPQNVLVQPKTGRLKLIDFGSAALFTPGAPAALVEEFGGTQNYMSPERHFEEYEELGDGREGFDGPAADIFSLGCLTFFTLRGHVPFDWEAARHRLNCSRLTARLKANDLFGGAQDHKDDECEEDEEEEEDDDEKLPILTEGAIDFVRRATRYASEERPTAQSLASHAWTTTHENATSTANVASMEDALGLLSLE